MKILIRATLIACLMSAPLSADQTSGKLDSLFDTLTNGATSPSEAHVAISLIWQEWLQSDNAEAEQMMRAGIRLMNSFALGKAADVFTKLIALEPDYAEAWNKRATVYYMMGKFEESTEDVAKTVSLEPRHFGALSGQGLIYLQMERKEQALNWFKRALDVNPFMENIRRSVEELEEELSGKVI